jgi:hypothetical protein
MLTSTNSCLYCGAINQPAVQNCVACGGSLTDNPAFDRPEKPHDWQPIPDPDQLPGIRPFDFGDVLTTTLKLFTRHFWLIIKIVFVIVAPFEIFKATTFANAAGDGQTKALTLVLAAICNVLIAPALIYALMSVLQTGTTPSVQESYRWGVTKLVRFSVCAALAYFIQGIGYILCIIPGIILALKYAVVYPVAILENGRISRTFSRSDELTRGSKLEIFGTWIVIGLLLLIVMFPVNVVQESAHSELVNVVGNIVIDIAEQVTTVLSLVIYLSLLQTRKQVHSILSSKN